MEPKKEQTISTPVGQKLYWDYHCYVKENPITTWNVPTSILYGKKDFLCEKEYVLKFKEKFSCDLQIAEESGHFFYTTENLATLSHWIKENI